MKHQGFLQLSALLCLSGSFLLVSVNSVLVPRQSDKSVSQQTTGKRIPRIQIDSRSTILAQDGGMMTPQVGQAGGMMIPPGGQSGGMMTPQQGHFAPGMGWVGSPPVPVPPLVIWNKPTVSPKWLERGRETMRKFEDTRYALEREWEADYSDTPLLSVVQDINEQLSEVGEPPIDEPKLKVTLDLNLGELENAGQSPESVVTIKAKGPLRLVLKRMLEPIGCDYIIKEGYVEITSVDISPSNRALRTYDLTNILPNNRHAASLIRVIINSISPEEWETGSAVVELFHSVMIIRAREGIHMEIEQLLSSLTEVKLREPDVVPTSPEALPPLENTEAEKVQPVNPNSAVPLGSDPPPASAPTENEKEDMEKNKVDGKTVQDFQFRSNRAIRSGIGPTGAIRGGGMGGMGGGPLMQKPQKVGSGDVP